MYSIRTSCLMYLQVVKKASRQVNLIRDLEDFSTDSYKFGPVQSAVSRLDYGIV